MNKNLTPETVNSCLSDFEEAKKMLEECDKDLPLREDLREEFFRCGIELAKEGLASVAETIHDIERSLLKK